MWLALLTLVAAAAPTTIEKFHIQFSVDVPTGWDRRDTRTTFEITSPSNKSSLTVETIAVSEEDLKTQVERSIRAAKESPVNVECAVTERVDGVFAQITCKDRWQGINAISVLLFPPRDPFKANVYIATGRIKPGMPEAEMAPWKQMMMSLKPLNLSRPAGTP